jgi:hypothetical protein
VDLYRATTPRATRPTLTPPTSRQPVNKENPMTDRTPAAPLTDQQLADIAARHRAATPGPWHANTPVGVVADNTGHVLAVFGGCEQDERDAAFTAHARTDVEALLDEVCRQRDRIAELERPAVEARRAEVRQSFTELIAQAEQDRDFEGAFDVRCRLREREEQWATEDASEAAGAPAAAEQPAGVPESRPDHERPSEAFLRAETVAARVQAIRDLADKADPPRPEISFFGDHGHVVGEWMREQAEYEERRHAAEAAPDIAAADNPTPLRWGLNDVLWGDDDTVTVLLSGPGGEPYWLELDPERAAVLREDLAGPDTEETHDDSAGLENGHGDTAIRLDDGSTHTHTAITNAGEACLMHACRAALEETRLRQEQYTLRAKIDGVLDEVDDLAADGDIPARAADRLRLLLRDALGLNTGT